MTDTVKLGDEITPRTFVIYHGNCFDGFAGAFAAWKALGDNAEYIAAFHGQNPPKLPPNAKVVIVDFSYPKEVLMEMKKQCVDVVVLDHHKTAEANLQGLDFATFDMNKSGAVLSWEYFHPGKPVPELLLYVQDRDLWNFALPKSEEVTAAYQSYPVDTAIWDKFDMVNLKEEGRAILRFKNQMVDMICNQSYLDTLPGGHKVPVVNSTAFWSEVGNKMLNQYPDYPFTASWYKMKNGDFYWSFRSRKGGFDVGKYAQQYGGGGHQSAAGTIQKGQNFRDG